MERAIVFLNGKPDIISKFDNVGVVNYKAMNMFGAPDVPHGASNIGCEPGYTLQITGTYY